MNNGASDSRSATARDHLIAVLGEKRYQADWTNPRHRIRLLLSEFIGTFGLLFALSAGAAAITAAAGGPVSTLALIALLPLTSALWLAATVFAPGDLLSHFNSAMTFAVAL